MIKFEKVSRFKDVDFNLPSRKTANSAGYDFEVAEDILVPPYKEQVDTLFAHGPTQPFDVMQLLSSKEITSSPVLTLSEMAALTKSSKAKPTLVTTGVKCHLNFDTYLELSVRSSSPLKYWLVLANGVGIIDADYCDNPDNEGEIFFQLINLSPFPIQLKKGDIIGQGIIKHYIPVDDDNATGERLGGFGSTTK